MDWYPVVKALHVISVIAWMAGMFYLPRLFVYHAEAGPGTPQSETFKVMERRLLRAIMNPAMIATWVFGIAMLAMVPDWLSDGWMHAKLTLVAAMTVVHHLYGRWRKAFERDENVRPSRFYRIWNEAPTLLLVGIVFLVILKPF
ncbi:membrane protein [Thalassobaculum fulvum]|jgi:putative membrane protein|uniref:Protoporphyrinogen IX oxidase n=1 Tax=Thalassobaculum fulvum TaxID=1633335 RepID=A0A919CMP0_9PROT|nr:protoporphyrinogen oxidase HemJ [Thalassobaculum fulvum]GHD39684.1 membrane protein [Thalassobaculum fulvum]